ncbi:MAG: hypothetical protein NT126_12905 [Bacteroidetes bacterium]|nr:hypothetical protein [Bacteroidota bacterium]
MNPEQVEKYRKDLEIIRLTAEQIKKDFQLFGHEISFSGNEMTAYAELKDQVTPLLDRLYQDDSIAFQSLLYRIDISEKKYTELLNHASQEEFAWLLADLVIQREFQKVLTRKFFS